MKPINNWDNVQAAGNIETLPAGGYVCEITEAKEVKNRNSDGTHLEISFDVCEGDWRGFFMQDYKSQNREDKFWRGVLRQNIPNEKSDKYSQQCRFFKRFTNAIEDSNPGYHWDWNEAGLKGKIIGIVFGEREKESQRGTIYIVTEAKEAISADNAREGRFKVPEKKCLNKTPYSSPANFAPLDDEDEGDVPF